MSTEKNQSRKHEGWKDAHSCLQESSFLPSLRTTPRKVFNKTFTSHHCWGGWNGSPQVASNHRQMHLLVFPLPLQCLYWNPREQGGKVCLKLSRHCSWAGMDLRILNTPRILFSSSQGIMNRTDLGFLKLLSSPFFLGSHREEDISGGCILADSHHHSFIQPFPADRMRNYMGLCRGWRYLVLISMTWACVHIQPLSHVQLFVTLWTVCSLSGSSAHGILQARILKCHFLLQGIFLAQGSNLYLLRLLQWQVGSLLLSYLGSTMSWAPCWKSFVFSTYVSPYSSSGTLHLWHFWSANMWRFFPSSKKLSSMTENFM